MTIALTKDSIDIGIVVKDAEAALGVLPRHARLRGHRLDGRCRAAAARCTACCAARRSSSSSPPTAELPADGAARRASRAPTATATGRSRSPTSTRSPTACAAAGRKVVVKPREIRPGVRISMVEDPDGNWVEFLEVAPQG